MRKLIVLSVLLLSFLVTGFVYGYFVHRNKIFPYKLINKAQMHNVYRKSMQWSIGIYEGNSPFSLDDPEDLKNPVISARNVKDINAAFVADPFIFQDQGKFFMFFEVLNMDTYTGDIGYAISEDGKNWEYKEIVLDETFHLSYPGIYKWEDSYYMIPESGEDSTVRIYKSDSFPVEWHYVGNLLSGYPYIDPTAFYYEDKWWMFTSSPGNNLLNLYFSDSLTSGWKAHPMNPVMENNPHLARPAGRVFEFENKLFRLAQDDYPSYGIQVLAIEINELDQYIYKENSESPYPIVTMSNKGWNAAGMHQVDFFQINNKWHAVVDGLKRRP